MLKEDAVFQHFKGNYMVWFNTGKNRSTCNIQIHNVDGKGCMRNYGSVYLKYIRNEE